MADHTADWGGDWTATDSGGEVALPVAAGLRRGLIEGTVTVSPREGGCTVTLEVTATAYSLNWVAVSILTFGATGGLVLLLWPLFPQLLALAPLAAIAAFSSWFLVASRLRTSSPEDYLRALAKDVNGTAG